MVTVGGAISGYSAIGQAELRDAAEDQDDDREDGGEDRPVDEEMGKAHRTFGVLPSSYFSAVFSVSLMVPRSAPPSCPVGRRDWPRPR